MLPGRLGDVECIDQGVEDPASREDPEQEVFKRQHKTRKDQLMGNTFCSHNYTIIAYKSNEL